MIHTTFLSVVLAWSLAIFVRAGQDDLESIRVLALDCEIEIPAYYTLQTQDVGSVAFFSPRLDEAARILISAPSNGDSPGNRVRTVSRRTQGHLEITKKEFLRFAGQPDREPLPFVEIRSRSQQAVFFGDAVRFVDGIVDHCLSTIEPEKRESYERRAAGCAYDLTLHPTFNFVFESAKFLTMFSESGISAWSLDSVRPGGVLDRHGLKDGDRITSICGAPLAVATSSGGSICCSSGSPDELSLTIEILADRSKYRFLDGPSSRDRAA